MKCPVDGETLVMAERHGVEIDYCPKCRGVWLDRGELDKIIDKAAGPMALPDPEPAPAPEQTPEPDPAPQPRVWQEPYREERPSKGKRYTKEKSKYSKSKRRRDEDDDRRYRKKKSWKRSILEEIFDFD
ncbi:zf-TFIIB domain-containing protein [Alisedimentitalea sp. MJ-SS2]|uniref:TFIIB-type zinc ribbon-containing protein n=1 Tax=Aliisedimentitalea sp. MJ-SS2 TaxID=3049795 RepID=UPI002909963F|nr:zf-TFIIB domain-containing protein [Alisedimentitalea sp. MJ-SS2]MDU8925881.1 zf-TFIIB domain-containing protein [Alisedimentitalea sp. MJ-SS2]